MTLSEAIASDSVALTADNVGKLLGIAPARITEQARTDPAKLGFPVTVACGTVRIPRKAFLNWIGESEIK